MDHLAMILTGGRGTSLQRHAKQTSSKLSTASPHAILQPLHLSWNCSYCWFNIYVFLTMMRLKRRKSQWGSRTYVSKAPDIKGRGKGSQRLPLPLFISFGQSGGKEVQDFSRSHWICSTMVPIFPGSRPSVLFFTKKRKEFLKQLTTEKNSKIKMKHH